MLLPKRVKHRKQHRGRRTGIATRGATIAFGEYALQALEDCWMTNRQIEAARRAMTRYVRRGGKIWIRIFPDKPVTKKPAETRMGSGKGNPEGWVAVIKPGRILFEMSGVAPEVARNAMRLAAAKLPIRTRFVMVADQKPGLEEDLPASSAATEATPPRAAAGTRAETAPPPAPTAAAEAVGTAGEVSS